METAEAASSFNPTIFVNTEAFLAIDDDDTSADVVLRFGDTLAKTLTFNRSLDRFEFNDDVYTSGSLAASGTLITESGAYIDGSTFVVQAGNNRVGIGTATPDTALDVVGAISGSTLLIQGSANIAGQTSLGDSSSDFVIVRAGSVEFQNDTNMELLGGQNGLSIDTSTLSVDATANSIGIRTTTPKATLDVVGSISGAFIYATRSFSGAGLSDCDGSTHALLWDATTGRFSCDTTAGTTYTAGQGLSLSASNAFSLKSTVTGAVIQAANSLASSGALSWKGTATGSILNAGGGNIVMSASGATVFNELSKPVDFRIEGDTDANAFFVDGSTDRIGIGTTTPDVKLDVVGTISGSLLTQNGAGTNYFRGNVSIGSTQIHSNLALEIFGTLSGSSVQGAGLSDCDTAGTSKLLWDATTGRFSCGTDQGASYTAGQGLNLNGTSFKLNAAITGSTVKVSGTIASSGQILAVGNITTKSGALVTRHGLQFLSGGSLTYLNGFDQFVNLPTGGLGTDGWSRISNQGNLENIGNIQAGQTHLRRGGTFLGVTNYTTGINPGGVAVGDLNGDGYADMAVTNISGNSVSVFLNTGTGGFAAKTDYSTGSNAQIITIKDLNGDGKPDLVSANSSSVSVFLNKGNGTFQAAVNYGAGFASAAVGDVNGDGKSDIVGLTYANPSLASVYLNNGDGTFGAKSDYAAGTFGAALAIGDINGDGRPDLATTGFITNQLYVVFNTGTGGFRTPVTYSAITNATAVAIGDVNGDKKNDVVVGGNSVSVFLNTGTGSMATKVDYAGGSVSVAIGDLNGDGIADIASADGTSLASIYLNNGNGTFATKADYTIGSTTKGVAIGDMNRDGKADVAVTRNGSSAVGVILNESKTILFAGSGTGGAVGIGTSTPGSALSVSGSALFGSNITNRAAKARLEVVGILSGVTLYATKSFSGAGLSDCDNATNSKLLWDATTGRFSCGTDQTGGGSGGAWSNTGSLQLYFDNRFVNVAGDTMTGALAVQNGTVHAATLTALLNVRGTMSGKSLNIMGSGASALLSTDTGSPNVRIGGSGMLLLGTRNAPSTVPANTTGLYAQKVADRPMIHQASGSTFAASALQPSLFGNLIMILSSGGGTTVNGYGTTATNDTTVSHPASGEVFGYMTNFATSTTANDEAGTSSTTTAFFRGSTTGANGFFYSARIGVVDVTSITVFSGMANQTIATMVGADDPAGNHVGFQFSTGRGDTNWMFTTKDNTTQNVNSTGMAFTANKVYDLMFMCTKQCASITWEIRNVTDGTSATGTTSSNLPAAGTALRIVLGVETETTAAKNIRMQQIYVEADR